MAVRQFRDPHEVLLAKGCLESAGIQVVLIDDMVRLDWFYTNLLGGIKLRVRPEDAEDVSYQELNELASYGPGMGWISDSGAHKSMGMPRMPEQMGRG